jgi:hypothetical protein
MDPTSYHYNDDVKYMELEEVSSLHTHVCAIKVYYHFSCDICKIRLARGKILFRNQIRLAKTNETQDVII